MPFCRTCRRRWPEGARVCPEDGTRLEDDRAVSSTVGLSQPQAALQPTGYEPTGAMAPLSQDALGYEPTSAMAPLPVDFRAHAPPAVTRPPTPARAAVDRALSRAGLSGTAAPAPDADTEYLAPGTVVGEYRIERKLGEGGMGAVYAARHPLIGKRAAIKVITRVLSSSTEGVERFILEARSVNQIGHPNIVDVFAFGTLPDGRCYFVMELLQGESLGGRMAREPLALGEAIEVLDAIAKALDAAHEAGIIHRDLKPDNVFLEAVKGERPQVKLLDFGLAKLSGTGAGDLRAERTRSGIALGTPLYISPEQAKGRAVDHRTDIYALGVMAFEIILRTPPFLADSAVQIMAMHISDPPPRPSSIWPDIPPVLEALILTMLEKDPARRPSLAEVRNRLAELRGAAWGAQIRGSIQVPAPALPTPASGSAILRAATPPPHMTAPHVEMSQTPPAPFAFAPPLAVAETQMLGSAPALITGAQPVRRRRRARFVILGAALAAAAGVGVVLLARGSGGGDSRATTTRQADAPAPAEAPLAAPVATPAEAPAAGPGATPAEAPTAAPAPAQGTLAITVNVANARIEVDGRTLATSADHATVQVDAGDHTVVVTAPRRKSFDKKVSVTAGAELALKVHLDRGSGSASGPGTLVDLTDTKPTTTTTTDKPPANTTTTTTQKKPTDIDAVADPFARPKK